MIETKILEAIKQMPNVERLKIIEFTFRPAKKWKKPKTSVSGMQRKEYIITMQ